MATMMVDNSELEVMAAYIGDTIRTLPPHTMHAVLHDLAVMGNAMVYQHRNRDGSITNLASAELLDMLRRHGLNP